MKNKVSEDNFGSSKTSVNTGSLAISCAVVPVAGKGRGVIAMRDFEAGETLEQAPAIVVPARDIENICQTVLDDFWYEWGENGACAVAGGCGSFYNHSFDPNADFLTDISAHKIVYLALKPIRAGEEVTINYNGPGYFEPVGFEVH